MDERIYCPQCEGTEVEKNYDAIGQNRSWSVEGLRALKNISVTRLCGRVVIRHRDSDEETQEESYIPESYRCKGCRKCFFSSKTYADEIHWAQKHKKDGLVHGFLNLFLFAFSLLVIVVNYITQSYSKTAILATVVLIYTGIVCLVAFYCAVFSNNVIKRMKIQWKEYLDVQAKHNKTLYGSSKERIPTWKRIQLEQEQSQEKT